VAKSSGPLAAEVILAYCVVPFNATLPGTLVVPDVNVRVTPIAVVNPPVPVYVKLFTLAMSNTVVAAVVWASTMLFEPNAIARLLLLLELNMPVVNVNPFKVTVPFVSVVVSVAPVVSALPKLQLPPTPLNVIAPFMVTAFVVIV